MSDEQEPERRLQGVDRRQMLLRPVVVEELIGEDHPARAIWEFVGRLDLSRYVEQVRSVEGAAGRPAWDPHLLISIWIYSYSRGVSSAREIERLCEYDPAYQWLTGMQTINAHTLSDFRVDHGAELHDLFVQVLGLLNAEGLITLERVMQDGTRVRASASSSRFHRRSRIESCLEEAREAVEALEAAGEEDTTLRLRRARERAAREKQERLESALKQFEQLKASKSRVERVSTTDPEARIMKQPEGGAAPSYNVQIVTDAAHSLIVEIEPTQAGSDYRQLTPALERLERSLQRQPSQVVVDGGYISSDNIVAMAQRGVELIGPEPANTAPGNRQKSFRHRGVSPEYETAHFRYEPASDSCLCPQGKRLSYEAKYHTDGMMRYRYLAKAEDCRSCPAKRFCCPGSRYGRSIERSETMPALSNYRLKMKGAEARAIYRTRSQVAEFPNLWIKTKLALRQFRLRGLAKVRSECLWAALTYDIQQWIRLRRRPMALASA